jgi:hypothetical protein
LTQRVADWTAVAVQTSKRTTIGSTRNYRKLRHENLARAVSAADPMAVAVYLRGVALLLVSAAVQSTSSLRGKNGDAWDVNSSLKQLRTKRDDGLVDEMLKTAGLDTKKQKIMLWTDTYIDDVFKDTAACSQCHYSNSDFHKRGERWEDADAIVFNMASMYYSEPKMPKTKPLGQIWIGFCLESYEVACKEVKSEEARQFDFLSNNSFFSDIPALYPVPAEKEMLQSVDVLARLEAFKQHNKQSKNDKLEAVGWRSSRCFPQRDSIVEDLNRSIRVASYGKCLHSKDGMSKRAHNMHGALSQAAIDAQLNDDALLARHPFYLAIENAIGPWRGVEGDESDDERTAAKEGERYSWWVHWI